MIRILPANLRFGPLLTRASTRRVIIHHSASPDVPAEVIHAWHLARGWSGIGYQFVIRADGSIEAGRPSDTVGAHAGPGVNHDSIGVCLTGDFTQYGPADRQLLALVRLVDHLEYTYGTMLEVLRHCDVAATACPGSYFPWPEHSWPLERARTNENSTANTSNAAAPWKESLVEEAVARRIITAPHHPDEPACKWFVLAAGLNIMKELEKHESQTQHDPVGGEGMAGGAGRPLPG